MKTQSRQVGTPLTQVDLDNIVAEARQRFRIPAIAVKLLDSENVLLETIQGVRIHDKPQKATWDDYFHIGSCSKSVLAVMAAKLVEQGKVDWNTRFFELFPELQAEALADYEDITLQDLFLCEAGIQAYTDAGTEKFPEYSGSAAEQRLAFIKDLLKKPPVSPKKHGRFKFTYSNASYTMASAMLEKVTGQDYETMVEDTLRRDWNLSPYLGWPNRLSPDQPWGHLVSKRGIEAYPPDHPYRIPAVITPAGDISFTPNDFARYTQMHLRGPLAKDDYLTEDSWRTLHYLRKGFSLGIVNESWAGKRISGFDGSAGTFYCRGIVVPEADIALVIMMNAGTGKAQSAAVEWITRQIAKKYFRLWWMFW